MTTPPKPNMVTPLEPPEIRNDTLAGNNTSEVDFGNQTLSPYTDDTSNDDKNITLNKSKRSKKKGNNHSEEVSTVNLKASVSQASSEIPSNATSMLEIMYPKPPGTFAPIKSNSKLMHVLLEVVKLSVNYISAFDSCGYNKPSVLMIPAETTVHHR